MTTQSPVEATVELDSTSINQPSRPFRDRLVSLVEGSASGLSEEIQQLLRRRLRIASLLMFAGFVVFLIRAFVFGSPLTGDYGLLLWAHVAVTAMLGLCAARLCRTCPITTKRLRLMEIAVFGAPAAFFVLWQYAEMTLCAAQGFLPNPASVWLTLMFTYAMFIPNRWPRAVVVIGSMAAAPVALASYLIHFDQTCAMLPSADLTYLSGLSLYMTIAAVSSAIGVAAIHGLRDEAFEARQLGQYRLRERLGSGGMGEVYLAEHQLLKRSCAVKLIRPEKALDSDVLARFEREVQLTARLSHWNNIEIYDYGRTADGTFYYVMEYLPGMNLHDMVQLHGPLAPERVVHFLTQTCDALSEAHQLGLIHRDIKPANIFAAQRGGRYDVTKLLDFGLAKPLNTGQSVQLTLDNIITGSPLYMSPEQALGDTEPDARSDIYSLGVVAYFLLSGHPPFNHEKPMKVLLAHANDGPSPLTSMAPDVPADLERIVMRCLEKQPANRYQSVDELNEALRSSDLFGRWNWNAAAAWWANVTDKSHERVVHSS